MSKEYWIHCYDCAIEDIANDNDISMDDAEVKLIKLLDDDTSYLDGYLSY